MNAKEIIAKADRGEGLTVEEIKVYQQAAKPVKHVYGKYGTMWESIGRLKISPNICTALTDRRMNSMRVCTQGCQRTRGTNGQAILWKTIAARRKSSSLSRKRY